MADKNIITRKEAISKGLRHYYTGNSCKNGHISERYITGMCVTCAQEYRDRGKEKRAEYDKEYAKKNKKSIKEKQRNRYLDNRNEYLEKARERRIIGRGKSETKIYMREYRKENIEKLKTLAREFSQLQAKYIKFSTILTVDDSPEDDGNGMLIVVCWYCGKRFHPKNIEARARAQCLVGQNNGEARLYCSSSCKKSCPTYNKKKYQAGARAGTSREMQPEFRKKILQRDGWRCQKCGAVDRPLHAHHITPHSVSYDSMNANNGITLCSECHKEAHKKGGDCSVVIKRCSPATGVRRAVINAQRPNKTERLRPTDS